MNEKKLIDKIKDENKEEWMKVNEALFEAKEKFYEVMEEEGYDGAYWALGIDVFFLSSDFTEVLQAISWDNIQDKVDDVNDNEED